MHAWGGNVKVQSPAAPVILVDQTALDTSVKRPEDAAELLLAHVQRHIGDTQPAHHPG
jgi:hypothetical protein